LSRHSVSLSLSYTRATPPPSWHLSIICIVSSYAPPFILPLSSSPPSLLPCLHHHRDLARNWDIDIASSLEDYLDELDGLKISLDGGQTNLNFAEAALLIQVCEREGGREGRRTLPPPWRTTSMNWTGSRSPWMVGRPTSTLPRRLC